MKTIKSTIKIFLLLGLFTGACEKESGSSPEIQHNHDLNARPEPLTINPIAFTKESETNTLIEVELEETVKGDFNLNHKHVNQAIDARGDKIDLN